MTTQENSTSTGTASLADLVKSGAVQLNAEQRAALGITDVPAEVATDTVNVVTEPVTYVTVQETVADNPPAKEVAIPGTIDTVKAEAAVTEATLDEEFSQDAAKDKADGATIEIRNVVIDAMRKLVAESDHKRQHAKQRVQESLKQFNIDPNNITITGNAGTDPLLVHRQLTEIQNATANVSFPVIALKSGYRATMSAMSNNEKIAIRNIKGGALDQTIALLRIIHAKIIETSVGRMSFDRFLDVTAEDDVETLVYGIFHATFPEAIEYDINCPHCNTVNKLKVHPDSLIEVIDHERAGKYVQEVLNGYDRGEEFLAKSLAAQTQRILLPNSKYVIELGTPTLRRMINNMRLAEASSSYQTELVLYGKFVLNFYAPILSSAATAPSYVQVVNIQDILKAIDTLDGEDMRTLRKAVSARYRQYHIDYRIKGFTCANVKCAKPVNDVSIDMTRLIFFASAEE